VSTDFGLSPARASDLDGIHFDPERARNIVRAAKGQDCDRKVPIVKAIDSLHDRAVAARNHDDVDRFAERVREVWGFGGAVAGLDAAGIQRCQEILSRDVTASRAGVMQDKRAHRCSNVPVDQALVSGSCSRVSNVSLPQFGHLGILSPLVTCTRS
jgi:hypothetical protein